MQDVTKHKGFSWDKLDTGGLEKELLTFKDVLCIKVLKPHKIMINK